MRRLSAIFATVAASIAIWFVCAIPFRDNVRLRALEERTAAAQKAYAPDASPLALANLADLERIERSHQLDAKWYLLYGANCEVLQRWPQAANSYTRALAIDQRPEIYFDRGLVMVQIGKTEEAMADLAMAVRFDPRYLQELDGELRARVAAAAEVP